MGGTPSPICGRNPQNSIWKAPLYNLTFTLIWIRFTCFRVRWHDLVNDNRISSLLLYLFEDCRLVHYFPCNNGPSTENLLKYTIVHPHISCINPNDLVGTLRKNTFGNLPLQLGPRWKFSKFCILLACSFQSYLSEKLTRCLSASKARQRAENKVPPCRKRLKNNTIF